ncbi:unnamed protein product [Orchesella dallaii]|uniref:Uncharacterized protein n=1 Tax=Orchesella dallaii TaxID=48710 RepID=A0ABP1RJR2_9HEXA
MFLLSKQFIWFLLTTILILFGIGDFPSRSAQGLRCSVHDSELDPPPGQSKDELLMTDAQTFKKSCEIQCQAQTKMKNGPFPNNSSHHQPSKEEYQMPGPQPGNSTSLPTPSKSSATSVDSNLDAEMERIIVLMVFSWLKLLYIGALLFILLVIMIFIMIPRGGIYFGYQL